MTSLDPNILKDLKLQLERELTSIMTKYTHYVRHIRLSLKDKGVSAEDLCSDLLTMPATSHTEQDLMLLSAHKAELEKLVSLNGIFNFLVTEYASFLNYDIFQFIIDTYKLDHGQEELKYPEQLKAYLEKHKVSEFIEVNPLQKKSTAVSTELTLKIDIELTTRMSKIIDLQKAIAKILHLNHAALQLVDIKNGCVAVTFLIPTSVAESVFKIITEKQEEQFRTLAVTRLECNGCIFIFAAKNIGDNIKKANNSM